MTSTKVFLTVDSGGSKTKLCLYDYENNPVKDTVLKGFGAATESDLVIQELKTALVDFCSGFSVWKSRLIMLSAIFPTFPW